MSVRAVVSSLTKPRTEETFGLVGFVRVSPRAQPSESVGWRWEARFDSDRPREADQLFVLDARHEEERGCAGSNDQGFTGRANYRRDRVTVLIPRRCLALASAPRARPRWARVSVASWHGKSRTWEFHDNLGSPASGQYAGISDSHFSPRLFPG